MSARLNQQISMKLEQAADLLERQGANPFRVRAYRQAARSLAELEPDVAEILEKRGHSGLVALPHIGKGIATSIGGMIATGRWSQLERLRGTVDPVQLFQSVPGIGPTLAREIHDSLHVDTLEGLEAAAYDGRLDEVPGFGARRLAAVQASLGAMLRRTRKEFRTKEGDGPSVALLLDVDERYRRRAAAQELPMIAPKRFNPDGKAWLPVMHFEDEGWHFTAMYSNTARAHQLDRLHDWVVIYHYDDHHREGQHTVVTETRGPLMGRRVVRGREAECRSHYRSAANERE